MATVVSQICVSLRGRPELSWGNFVAGHQSGLRGRGTPHWQYVLAHLALLATIKKRSETRNRIHENALLQISPLRTSSLILTSSGHSWDVQSASESSTLTPICFQGNQFSKTKFELVSIQRKLPCIPRRRCADDLVKHYSTTIRLSRCNSHHLTCNPPWCAQISVHTTSLVGFVTASITRVIAHLDKATSPEEWNPLRIASKGRNASWPLLQLR